MQKGVGQWMRMKVGEDRIWRKTVPSLQNELENVNLKECEL